MKDREREKEKNISPLPLYAPSPGIELAAWISKRTFFPPKNKDCVSQT